MGLFWSVLSKIISIIVFLIVLLLLNIYSPLAHSSALTQIVSFINANVFLIIFISVLFVAGDVFLPLAFPLNLPFPLFNAIGAVFLAVFLIRLIGLIDSLTGIRIFSFVSMIAPLIYTLVFVLALILGYVEIFSEKNHKRRHANHRT